MSQSLDSDDSGGGIVGFDPHVLTMMRSVAEKRPGMVSFLAGKPNADTFPFSAIRVDLKPVVRQKLAANTGGLLTKTDEKNNAGSWRPCRDSHDRGGRSGGRSAVRRDGGIAESQQVARELARDAPQAAKGR